MLFWSPFSITSPQNAQGWGAGIPFLSSREFWQLYWLQSYEKRIWERPSYVGKMPSPEVDGFWICKHSLMPLSSLVVVFFLFPLGQRQHVTAFSYHPDGLFSSRGRWKKRFYCPVRQRAFERRAQMDVEWADRSLLRPRGSGPAWWWIVCRCSSAWPCWVNALSCLSGRYCPWEVRLLFPQIHSLDYRTET